MTGRKLLTIIGVVCASLLIAPTTEAQQSKASVTFITPNTFFLEAPWALLDNVNDDVFWVIRGSGFLSTDEKYEFWKVDGTKLFDAEWEKTYSDQPIFNSGVVPMRRPSGNIMRKGNICLLYTDGKIKDLNVRWDKVTNFKDGVAVVMPSMGSGEAFYIDTTGKRIYPNIKVDGYGFNIIRPLRDGMRAYKAYGSEWGYIDANGVVKLSPKYKDAREFSEGYAWVRMEDGTQQLIDKTGKSVFKASSGAGRTSDVVDGRFYVDEGSSTCYYDLKGNQLACFDLGNQFYGGYAFVSRPKSFGDVDTQLIDTAMNIVREIPWTLVDVGMVSEKKPIFTSSGLANVNNHNIGGNSYLLKPNADIALAGYENNRDIVMSINEFKPVSDCGYFVANINIELDAWSRLNGRAVIKTTGEVVMIVSEDKGFVRSYGAGYPVRQSDLDANGGSFTIKALDISQPSVSKKASVK
ncbi:MAG: WG repeat-containing protein [Muribaculaceae bacterium]|nr:WG repeat-containing protein [Muribaculaceae bacterium]